MKWSWRLVRIAGIEVRIHATFLILIAWLSLSFWQVDGQLTDVLNGVGFILALFTCVVLHEFGHAMMARRFGIRTKHITLLPIGGIAALEKMPEDPKQEMKVALAGPAVNVVLALGLWLWIVATNGALPSDNVDWMEQSFAFRLMAVNIILAVFNMLPALPMDGGRVFRAALAMQMDHHAATEKAAKLGQGLAFVLGFLGLLYNPLLLFIALFVWIGAAAELHSAEIKSTLAGIPIGRAMLTEFHTLLPSDRLAHAVDLTLAGSQREFPVLENNQVVGVLAQHDIIKGLQAEGDQARVRDWMQQKVHSAEISDPLEEVLERLHGSPCRMLSVSNGGRFAGIINLDNFLEFLSIQAAMQTGERRGFEKTLHPKI